MHDLEPDLSDPPPYVVTCWEEDRAAGDGHAHVVAVRTQDPDGGQTRWATVEVIAAVREGESFIVGADAGDAQTSLEPAVCPACSTVTLSVGQAGTEVAICG